MLLGWDAMRMLMQRFNLTKLLRSAGAVATDSHEMEGEFDGILVTPLDEDGEDDTVAELQAQIQGLVVQVGDVFALLPRRPQHHCRLLALVWYSRAPC